MLTAHYPPPVSPSVYPSVHSPTVHTCIHLLLTSPSHLPIHSSISHPPFYTFQFIHPSIIHPPAHTCAIQLPIIHPPTCRPTHLLIHLCLPTCPSLCSHPPIHPPTHPFIYLTHPSACIPTYSSIYPFAHSSACHPPTHPPIPTPATQLAIILALSTHIHLSTQSMLYPPSSARLPVHLIYLLHTLL